jgi:membrane peptidoglycan carboxypeptidase
MMTDSLHSHNSNHDGLRSGRHRSLLARMPKPKPRKRLRPRGFFRRWKWVFIPVVVLLLIPAIQVAVVRLINPPLTLPMLIDQGSAMFSRAPKRPLLYHWIDLPQIPEMFLKHLWISEDQRFFQHEGFDWTEMELAVKEAERKRKPAPGSGKDWNRTTRSGWRRSCRSDASWSYMQT